MPSPTLPGHQPAAADDILDGADPSREGIQSDFEQSLHVTHTLAPPITTLEEAYGVVQRVRDRLRLAVRGRDNEIELIIIALLADGHALLEDYPGSGKTTLAKALGDCIIDDQPNDDIVTIRRIQFTPDLCRRHRDHDLRPQHQPLLLPPGTDLRAHRAGRRDQPDLAQGPVVAARSDGREADHRRQPHPQAGRASSS